MKKRLEEEESFEMFKTLLLRHAIQRPPHSLAVFSLQDVKDIDLFVQDTFYRHYSMYFYTLTVQDMLQLTSQPAMKALPRQRTNDLKGYKEVPLMHLDIMQQYMSQQEKDQIEAQKDYMERGPGKVEAVLNEEMARLENHL